MAAETGTPASCLKAGGGSTSDNLLMQLQANFTPSAVQVAKAGDLSVLGAAYVAGVVSGVYESHESVKNARPNGAVYTPAMTEKDRLAHRRDWKAAVARALK
jgi:glycerol kinase